MHAPCLHLVLPRFQKGLPLQQVMPLALHRKGWVCARCRIELSAKPSSAQRRLRSACNWCAAAPRCRPHHCVCQRHQLRAPAGSHPEAAGPAGAAAACWCAGWAGDGSRPPLLAPLLTWFACLRGAAGCSGAGRSHACPALPASQPSGRACSSDKPFACCATAALPGVLSCLCLPRAPAMPPCCRHAAAPTPQSARPVPRRPQRCAGGHRRGCPRPGHQGRAVRARWKRSGLFLKGRCAPGRPSLA